MKLIFSILIFLFLLNHSIAQQKDKLNYLETIISDVEISLIDAGTFITYPLRMSGTEWIATAGIGAGSYYLINNDDKIRNKINTEVDQFESNFWGIFEAYGVVQYAELAGATVYGVGLFAENDEVRTLGRMIIQSLTYSGVSAMFVRMIAGRKRPPYTDDPLNFIGFTTNNSYQSFPSGHTTVAFALSTVLAEYFDSPWSRIGFYGIAGLSATERLINNEHWFSDILLGAALGVVSGIHVINEEAKRKNSKLSKLSIQPTFNGINFRYSLN